MAKIFGVPTQIAALVVDYRNYDHKKELERETSWLAQLSEFCRKYGKGKLSGQEIRTPQADGYARYMVYSESPLQLIHLPLGDAWRASPIWERGLRVADVRQMVKADEAIAKLFSKK